MSYDEPPYDDTAYDGQAPYEADMAYDVDDELDVAPVETRRIGSRRGQQADAETLLRRVVDVVDAARPVPLSASAMINKDEVLELLEEALARLPDELREARWLRKERDEYLAKMRTDGEEITDAARARAEQMVQRTEVVKAAEHRARRIIEGAEAEARRLRLECEDFCDHRLASFEVVLERTMTVVASGRERLQATNLNRNELPEGDDGDEGTFFDPARQ